MEDLKLDISKKDQSENLSEDQSENLLEDQSEKLDISEDQSENLPELWENVQLTQFQETETTERYLTKEQKLPSENTSDQSEDQ